MVLDRINSPKDLKALNLAELEALCKEIRVLLIKKASVCGGHLASNLGVVEMTVALHFVFDSPNDRVIFDVSHQCYTHKILTGRKEAFIKEANYQDVTGYTNPNESVHDHFNIGHTSTSLSLACGIAKARDLKCQKFEVIAVIGDSAMDGGEAFEALNFLNELGSKIIIVLNDNHMSIPENHGFLNKHLNDLYAGQGKAKTNLFSAFDLDYIFVEDGHDISSLIDGFNKAKKASRSVVIHCRTTKGKGYAPAENNPEKWHHAHPFVIGEDRFERKKVAPKENYGSIVGDYLIKRIKEDPRVIAMTASVPACFGFDLERRRAAGKQFVDVGICEQHLVSMASGLAKMGMRPVVITESSFYQRAYDQIEQEMCINKCPVTLLVAFSGIHGHNDDTHIGFFDIGLFGNIPNLIYLAPSNKTDYLDMLDWSIEQNEHPVAIRIPWNGVHYSNEPPRHTYSKTTYRIVARGSDVAIIGLGSFFQLGEEVGQALKDEWGINATLIDPLFISGLDKDTLLSLLNEHRLVATLEDGMVLGGFGSKISQFYGATAMKVLNFGFGQSIPTRFATEEMLVKNGLTKDEIIKTILANL